MSDKPTTTDQWNIAANSCADQTAAQIEFLKGRVIDLEQQLAAELEKIPPPVDNKYVAEGCAQFGEIPPTTKAVFIMNRSLMLENEQLREQLAAEKEKWMKLCDKASDNATRAEQALAGEIKSHERTEGSLRLFAAAAGTLRKQLAAEREKRNQITLQERDEAYMTVLREKEQLQQQLAAERENSDQLTKQIAIGLERENKLSTQLAAEREQWQLATEECHRIISRKNEQLAAEREVGHNTAVALGQQIIKLEDQLGAKREKDKKCE